MKPQGVYVALDPGGTTGYAQIEYSEDGGYSFWTDQLKGQHHLHLYGLLEEQEPKAIACERFTYQRRDKVVLDSVEYIGVAKMFSQRTGTPLIIQTPSQAKNLWTDEKLKKLGLYRENMPHAMDAMRHLLYYVTVSLGDRQFVMALKD